MSQLMDPSCGGKQLRSRNDEKFALVTFVSNTDRPTKIFWIDYIGGRVLYSVLPCRESFEIMTYETHPWIFRDAESDSPLLANGQPVYLPRAWDGRDRSVVNIHIPVYSLREMCMKRVKCLHSSNNIRKLDIPRHLIPEILHEDDTPHLVHVEI